jgi:glc operon protein GlcG
MNAGVTAEQARAIVESVVTSRRGPVSVVVADDHGEVVASLRMDGAALDTMLNAQRKAYTAARSGATTTRELSNTDEDLSNFDPFFTFFLGGVAVFEGNRRVGAVGVSGLPGEVDEELAIAAIRAAGLEVPAGL